MMVVVSTDALPPPWGPWMMVERAWRAAAERPPRPPREEKGAPLPLPLLRRCPAIFYPIMAGPVCVLGGLRQAMLTLAGAALVLLPLPLS